MNVKKRLDERLRTALTRGIEFPNERWARIYNERYLKNKKKVKAFEPFN